MGHQKRWYVVVVLFAVGNRGTSDAKCRDMKILDIVQHTSFFADDMHEIDLSGTVSCNLHGRLSIFPIRIAMCNLHLACSRFCSPRFFCRFCCTAYFRAAGLLGCPWELLAGLLAFVACCPPFCICLTEEQLIVSSCACVRSFSRTDHRYL